MDALIRQIRDDFRRRFEAPPGAAEAERFVREAFAARNIIPTAELVQQVLDHLLHGTPVGHLTSVTIRHCGQ
jgi:hypothetical protein